MKYHYYKDLKKRNYLKKIELSKIICSFLVYSKEISNLERCKIYVYFFFLKKKNKNIELKNHCILTKNSRSVNRFTGLTRSNLKSLITWGDINGIRKWSW